MIVLALWQFGFGILALLIRYCECKKCRNLCWRLSRCLARCAWRCTCCGCSPCIAACKSCGRCVSRGLSACEGMSGTKSPSGSNTQPLLEQQRSNGSSDDAPADDPLAEARPTEQVGDSVREEMCLPCRLLRGLVPLPLRPTFGCCISRLASQVRWYWFSVAVQVGLMCREFQVISMLDGWYMEVVLANVAMWFVILFTARQVWNFSTVRKESPEAIDQVLDMLLLPINYGFLCALCVRILKVENTDQNRMIALAMIDSADIWESWALWSVLGLFVKVAENGSQRVVKQEADLETRRNAKAAEANAKAAQAKAMINRMNNQQSRMNYEVETRRRAAVARRLSEMSDIREEVASGSDLASAAAATPPQLGRSPSAGWSPAMSPSDIDSEVLDNIPPPPETLFPEQGSFQVSPSFSLSEQTTEALSSTLDESLGPEAGILESQGNELSGTVSSTTEAAAPGEPELLVPAQTWRLEGDDLPLQKDSTAGFSTPPRRIQAEDEVVPSLPSPLRDVPWSEVEAHNRRDDGWLVISEQVFDVTAWIPQHPGGEAAICKHLGGDATKEWNAVHDPEMLRVGLPHLRLVGKALEPMSMPMPVPCTSPSEELTPAMLVMSSTSLPQAAGASTGTRYLDVVNAFKTLSLSGVQAWVVILLVVNMSEILVKGIIAPSVPTLCFWLYKDCVSCNDWYNQKIYSVSQGVIYILCSFALVFVVAFERVFKDYLHQIEPYWKFWGVKIVVTVTYFQWLVFKYLLGLNDQMIYLWHSLACTLEMPLLCLMHATFAYPYGKPWVQHLIDEMPQKEEADGHSDGTRQASAPTTSNLCTAYVRLCFNLAVTLICCFISVKTIVWMIPPENDLMGQTSEYNISCSGGDLKKYIEEHAPSEHWVVPENMRSRQPGYSYWLPLCSSISVNCQLGYQGHHSISCSAGGQYAMEGKCSVVGCGTPPKVPHATLDFTGTQAGWTAGMQVRYACDKGYKGTVSAQCHINGSWTISRWCTLVGCGALEDFLQRDQGPNWPGTMTVKQGGNLTHSYVGDVVHFQCEAGYHGKPVATCQEGGAWALANPCSPFRTSLGCKCLTSWSDCSGWFGTECEEWYGCVRALEPFAWCKVYPNSCPQDAMNMWGVSPSWDYCVGENFNLTWEPKPLPDQGILPNQEEFYGSLICIGAAVLSFYCARTLTKGGIHTCCYTSVLLHKVVTPALSRCPGTVRRHWRILTFQLHEMGRSLVSSLARTSRRATEHREALQSRIIVFGSDLRLWGVKAGQQVSEAPRRLHTFVSSSFEARRRSALARVGAQNCFNNRGRRLPSSPCITACFWPAACAGSLAAPLLGPPGDSVRPSQEEQPQPVAGDAEAGAGPPTLKAPLATAKTSGQRTTLLNALLLLWQKIGVQFQALGCPGCSFPQSGTRGAAQ